jgi:hypothetical protein
MSGLFLYGFIQMLFIAYKLETIIEKCGKMEARISGLHDMYQHNWRTFYQQNGDHRNELYTMIGNVRRDMQVLYIQQKVLRDHVSYSPRARIHSPINSLKGQTLKGNSENAIKTR